ncbi:GNAT family N-acetyltransferase [Amnibacterium kyonggiense]|uniref:Acetyltransferase (GNAT) family protein n=1 Tax=Amnibacterium kyonggiense TaxID=595671 RepID=A0A4V6Q118_9MICO|nr:GNAT family N-acetyltransferase [Amnibacterium kyonggiense]TDS80994.1 acetyltransferase (GNAT) family protein [Amnibacterium kyonggiense]
MTVRVERVAWDDPRGVALRAAMDAEMGERYAHVGRSATAEEQAARARAFTIDPATMTSVLLAVDADGGVLGHAALRRLPRDAAVDWELKRLITVPEARGRGVGTLLVRTIEEDAAAAGATRVILQTGDRQPEAVGLYEKLGYRPIPAYPPYAGAVPEGLYFARSLG